MSNKNCSSNEIYSDLNYDKLREQNLKRTEELYNVIFSEYSGLYNEYINIQKEASDNPSNSDIKNRSDASIVQKKPIIIDLNKKLVNIETELLNNNYVLRKSIIEQEKDLQKEVKYLNEMNKKINRLNKNVKMIEDKSDTGKYTIKDIQTSYNKITKWYYFFMALVLIFFIIFCIVFLLILSSQSNE